MNYSQIRGFNYQPGYGSTGLENWLYFNPSIVELELRRGKAFFPKFNTVRYLLSWDAYLRDPEQFAKNFEKSLQIADKLGIKVIPCLFNRRHDPDLDYGGIYIDHFLPRYSFLLNKENHIDGYVQQIVSEHAGDDRILLWDICNEPFHYPDPDNVSIEIKNNELVWISGICDIVRGIDRNKPLGISIHPFHGIQGLERIEPLCDVLLIHPYYMDELDDMDKRREYEEFVAANKEFSEKCNKPILVTETCWGDLNDMKRADIVRYTLEVLIKNNIGFLAHALHYSKAPDLHNPEDGPVGRPGNLAFINADGSLREGHDVFNAF